MVGIKRYDLLRFGCQAALVALALGACADASASWQKPGATEAQRRQDYQSCRALAQDSSQAGIDQDLAASRAGTFHGPAGAEPPGSDVNTAASRASSAGLIACMTDKGYHGE
jgi:hypothetical protein